MAERKVTTPLGKTIYVPDSFTPAEELRAVQMEDAAEGSTAATAAAPTPTPSLWNTARAVLGVNPATRPMLTGLDAATRELTDPENLSSAGALVGGAGGALLGGPVGAVGGAALGGALASKFGEGKSWGAAAKEGALEGGFEAIGGPVSKVVGKYALAPLSRGLTGYALRPSRSVMDALIDPATGKQFATPGDAARYFRYEATRLMNEVSGTPGQSTYAKGIIGLNEADRAAKVATLQRSGKTLTTEDMLPQSGLDRLVSKLSQRSGDAGDMVPDLESAVRRNLARSHPVKPVKPGNLVPEMQPVPSDMPWSLPAADQRAGGLGEALDALLAARQKASMMGDAVPPSAAEEGMALTRDSIAKAIERAEPSVEPLNRAMRGRLPIQDAAIDATMPIWGDAVPRIRVSGTPTNPNISLFDYIRRGAGVAARPAHVTGKALQSSAARATTPQLLRLLNALTQGQQ